MTDALLAELVKLAQHWEDEEHAAQLAMVEHFEKLGRKPPPIGACAWAMQLRHVLEGGTLETAPFVFLG